MQGKIKPGHQALHGVTATDQSQQDCNYGQYQQDVNDASCREHKKPKHPANDQDDCNKI